jgi:hypothetical protein
VGGKVAVQVQANSNKRQVATLPRQSQRSRCWSLPRDMGGTSIVTLLHEGGQSGLGKSASFGVQPTFPANLARAAPGT